MLEEHIGRDQQDSLPLWHRRVWESWRAWIDRRPAVVLVSILLFALVLGLIKLRIDPPSPEFSWENRWWQIALNVSRGEGYVSCKPNYFPFCGPGNQVTAMREPLPVLVFALIALVTNESLIAAAALIVLINLAIIVALFYLTRELSNTRTALLAAFLWACYLPPIRLFYSQISGDLFACLGITCGLLYFLRAQKTNQSQDWLVSGLLFGLAILSRSAVLVVTAALTVALFFWLISRTRSSSSSRFQSLYPVIGFTFAWAVVMSPWIIRNTFVFERPVIGSTLSGYYLYRQHHILPTDDYLRFVSGGEFLPVLQEMVSRRPELTGSENEAQMNEIYLQEGMQIIKAHPLRYIALSTYRFTMLWFNWRVNEVYGKVNTTGDYLMVIQNIFLLTGGMIGLRGRFREAWPLVLSVVSFSGLYMAVMAHLPYIVPVVPGVVALSAIALAQFVPAFARNLNQSVKGIHEQ
jgi:4-amino-4-deoxy-L-arabinose transferase-like glycosyltransferase